MHDWEHQTRAVSETQDALNRVNSVCMALPTGGGKSRCLGRLAEWGVENEWPTLVYTPRKMLTGQAMGWLDQHGLRYGVRAASFEEHRDDSALVQVCSVQTEIRRKDSMKHLLPFAPKLVLVDEGHLFKSVAAADLMRMHIERGAKVVMATATPVGVGAVCEELIVAAENSELRRCGAHLPCKVYAPDEPDCRHVEMKKIDDEARQLFKRDAYRQQIFGRVYEHWKRLNPDGLPTILFAPGVDESRWFVDEFARMGVRAAHIDGEDTYMDGETCPSDRDRRDYIVSLVRKGEVQILCNRFVFREGVDIPELYHCILASPIGSVVAYVQSIGRLLRYYKDYDHVICQDHSGSWHRHGSPNEDRGEFWRRHFHSTESVASGERQRNQKEDLEEEPIHCPKCQAIRRSGRRCMECGYEADRRSRNVLQTDGHLREVTGRITRKPPVRMKDDTAQQWERCFWRGLKSGKTFTQMEGLFLREQGYYPPPTLPLMPKDRTSVHVRIKDLPRDLLIPKPERPPEPSLPFG